VVILAVVFALIAIRQVGRFRLRIWQIMLGGAVAVLVTGQIAPADAAASINADVMVFLFGMFVLGEALYESGYLFQISSRLVSRATSVWQLVLLLVFGIALFSAVLMNDTLAIIGTPLVLHLSRKFSVSARMLLLCLCFAITTGSVLSPIGNPQNLLVAVNSGIPDPFFVFLLYLGIPTIINLGILCLMIRFWFPGEFVPKKMVCTPEPLVDPALAQLSRLSLLLVLGLILFRGVFSGLAPALVIPLSVIAIGAALPVILFSPKRRQIVQNIDWRTLVFFAAMFVLMQSVFNSGFFQSIADVSSFTSVPLILATSIIISQFISNVPFVALFQPLILQATASPAQTMALAAGSTIAGNLTILGAASNVIVIQHAEREGETISFITFLKIGLPLTIINSLVYAGYLVLFT
jgi:Na+/H+ antiporter NhaD/arsenite permease-like protein